MSAAPATTLAAVLLNELARCGLREASLAPGSRSGPLAVAATDTPGVRVHVRIDERSASFLALGLAKAGGTPAIVISTSGTAAANFFPAVIEADQARVPLIVITADRPPELRETGANQTIDQTRLFGGAVRWWAEVQSDDFPGAVTNWRSVAARAWERALAARGPVHLNASLREPLVGDDVSSGDLGGRPGGLPWHSFSRGWSAAPDAVVERLAERASTATRGVIVAGDSDVDSAPVVALARRFGWPILAEPTSGLRCSELSISTYDALLRSRAWADWHRPDFVIRIGKLGTSKALLSWLDPEVEQVLIEEGDRWPDPTRSISEFVRADPSIVAEQLMKAVDPRPEDAWLSSWTTADGRAREVIDDILDSIDEPTEPRTARDLAELLGTGSLLVAGSSMPVRDVDSFMRVRGGLQVIANRGASGIDGFVSTAIGAALAHGGETAALAGDLSFLHDAGGLATLDGPVPKLSFVVVNNDGGGIFSFLPHADSASSFEKLFGTPHGLDLARVAALYGCGHSLLQSADELGPALDALPEGIGIVEVRTDRGRNVELHQRIWKAVESALSRVR